MHGAGIPGGYYDLDAVVAGRGLGGVEAAAVGSVDDLDVLHLQCHIGVDAWMRSAAVALRPGGRLVLVEIHPLYCMALTFDPLVVDFPYAFDGPREFDEPGSYADPDADVAATKEVVYAHSLGEVVTAAIGAGLRIDVLEEHTDVDADPRGVVAVREDDGRYRVRLGGVEPIPLLFTLLATRA